MTTSRTGRAAFLALALTIPAGAQSTLIPVAGARGHVFDELRSVLYITTAGGTVERYDVAQQRLLSPWTIGSSLNGCDITPDCQFLYVAEGNAGPTQGFIHRVDLSSGASTPIAYTLAFGEAGAWDISIANNGKGFLTTLFGGSGWVPLREIDVATGALTIRNVSVGSGFNQVRQNTHINRGADRSLLFFTESNISSGPIFTYVAATDTFVSQANTGTFHGGTISSVNRDGSLIATEFGSGVSVLTPTLGTVTTLAGLAGGCIFNTVQDVLYAVNTTTNGIEAYDTTTFQWIQTFPVGQAVGTSTPLGPGEMSMADDGSFLFLTTGSGVRSYLIGLPAPRIVSVAPARARFNAGPTPVTITGAFYNLGSGTTVSVGGVAATSVSVVDPTTITATFPPGPPGPADVAVSNSNGSEVLSDGFVYTPALLLTGEIQPGGTGHLVNLFEARSTVFGLVSVPPATAVSVPGIQGTLCLPAPVLLYQAFWPVNGFTLSFPIPAGASGGTGLIQALEVPPFPLLPTLTNCVVLAIP